MTYVAQLDEQHPVNLLARQLCRAAGHDPDRRVWHHGTTTGNASAPMWQYYHFEAMILQRILTDQGGPIEAQALERLRRDDRCIVHYGFCDEGPPTGTIIRTERNKA